MQDRWWIGGGGRGFKSVQRGQRGGNGVGGLAARGRNGGGRKVDGDLAGRDRAYGAGKLTPFLAYPRSLFNCILLSNFPCGAIDRDTRKRVRLRLISDSPRRLLSGLYLFRPFSPCFTPPSPARPCARLVPLLVFAPLIQLTHINPYSQKAWNVLVPTTVRSIHPFADYLKLHTAVAQVTDDFPPPPVGWLLQLDDAH